MILFIQKGMQDFQESSANPKGKGNVNLLFGHYSAIVIYVTFPFKISFEDHVIVVYKC